MHHNRFRRRSVGLKPAFRVPTCESRWRPSHFEKQQTRNPLSPKGPLLLLLLTQPTRHAGHMQPDQTLLCLVRQHSQWGVSHHPMGASRSLPQHKSDPGQAPNPPFQAENLFGRTLWSQKPVRHWAQTVMKCINHRLLYILRADGFYL